MDTPVIIDAIVAAILLGFVFLGVWRGLIRTAAGLLSVAAALVGAAMIANALTPAASGLLRPVIEKQVEERVDEALDSIHPEQPDGSRPEDGELSLGDLLDRLGVDAEAAKAIGGKAEGMIRDTGTDIVTAVVQAVAESILHAALFLLAFILLLIGLRLAVGLLDLAAKLPGVHSLNAAGGGLIGLIEGLLTMFLAVWVLRRFGVSFDAPPASQTVLLKFFAAHSPLSALALLGS